MDWGDRPSSSSSSSASSQAAFFLWNVGVCLKTQEEQALRHESAPLLPHPNGFQVTNIVLYLEV